MFGDTSMMFPQIGPRNDFDVGLASVMWRFSINALKLASLKLYLSQENHFPCLEIACKCSHKFQVPWRIQSNPLRTFGHGRNLHKLLNWVDIFGNAAIKCVQFNYQTGIHVCPFTFSYKLLLVVRGILQGIKGYNRIYFFNFFCITFSAANSILIVKK